MIMKKLLLSGIAITALCSSVVFAANDKYYYLHFVPDAAADFSKLQNKFGPNTRTEVRFEMVNPVEDDTISTSTYGDLKYLNNKLIESKNIPLYSFLITQKPDARYIVSLNIINVANNKVLYSANVSQPNHPLTPNEDYYMHIHSLNKNDASVDDNPA
jgi:hypothetical protein